MAKIKKIAIALLICSTGLMAAFLAYDRTKQDRQAPQISCPEETLEVSIHGTEEQLLDGVHAEDDRDGDVTDLLVIEKLSPITEDDTRIITYAASDAAGNVSRATRTLHYTDYKKPKIHISAPMRFAVNASFASLQESVRADSVLDGDLTQRIKYQVLSYGDDQETGEQTVEFRVTDSAGYNLSLEVNVEIYNPAEERIQVSLTDYLIYLPRNASFNAKGYFEEASMPGELEIQSDVNPSVPGVYTVEYIFHGEKDDSIGKSRLIVVVEE